MSITGQWFPRLVSLLGLCAFLSCSNEAKFEGGNNPPPTETPAADATPATDPSPDVLSSTPPDTVLPSGSAECTEPSADNLRGLPSGGRDCLNGKNIFHFETGKCVAISQFPGGCSHATLLSEVEKLGMSGSVIEEQKARGFALFGCGPKDNGNTIIAQWFDPRLVCSGKAATLVTGCFRLTQNPTQPQNDTDHAQIVKECLGL